MQSEYQKIGSKFEMGFKEEREKKNMPFGNFNMNQNSPKPNKEYPKGLQTSTEKS